MLNFLDYIKENNNKAFETSKALLIVDVQESFSKFITDAYVDALMIYAEKFGEVYQVWDNTDQHTKSFEFPNECMDVSKQYGSLTLDRFEQQNNFFHGEDIDRYRTILEDPSRGDSLMCKDGSIWLYVGENHEWFLMQPDLQMMLQKIKQFDIEPIIVGGAASECHADIYHSCIYFGLKPKMDFKYIYSATFCPKGI